MRGCTCLENHGGPDEHGCRRCHTRVMEVGVKKPKRMPSFALIPFLLVWLICGPALSAEKDSIAETCKRLKQQCEAVNVEAVKLAIDDMGKRFPGRYDAAKYRPSLDEFARNREALIKSFGECKGEEVDRAVKLLAGVRAALLANPLLDGEKILFVRRNIASGARQDVRNDESIKQKLGFISLNSHCHVTIARKGWNDEIAVLSDLRNQPKITTLYKPDRDVIVRDIDLDFAGNRLLFSSLDANRQWAVFEVGADGKNVKQVSPAEYPDVEWFDANYLPDGRVIMMSTASYQGLPCEGGSKPMATIYLIDPPTKKVRRLTYEQDSDYTPSITGDGRILYTRWEYSDLPHYFSRILMTMNPDGTAQQSVYGSGSYYPTTLLHARSIPNDPNRIIGIVGGHHDVPEVGRLVLFDTSLSRRYPFKVKPKDKIWGKELTLLRISVVLPKEETGCVAEIPGRGETVEGDVCDTQTGNQWERGKPFFIHPWPLDGTYFLVSAKLKRDSLWGIYLVDLFDNMTLLAEAEDAAFFEPVMFAPRERPPVIPDRVRLSEKTATVHIADIHSGPGLQNVPRGSVKSLRVFAYHFNYLGTGGDQFLGLQSGWDIKRILGTVPVEADGSVCFEIPANTPVSLQPLDGDGAALQVMRSWLVGMPGERVSCAGCHEDNRSSVPTGRVLADRIPARALQPWYGPVRPFSFALEVYPVLQKYCVGCHTGKNAPVRKSDQGGVAGKETRLSMDNAQEAHAAIHPYVRRPGPESDLMMYYPMEYHVSTSPLIQMLKKGHHGVKLDTEGWEKFFAWIDLNAPFKGKWNPSDYKGQNQKTRRAEMAKLYANTTDCPEDEYDKLEADQKTRPAPAFITTAAEPAPAADTLTAPGYPMNADQAAAAQKALGELRKAVELPSGRKLEFVHIPAGSFVMGSLDGATDERPRAVVKIDKPFWMAACEISNAQFHEFDAAHDSRYIAAHGKDHNNPGYIANHDNQPVARVTWKRSAEFCDWLSKRAGLNVRLPTEAQWEWAARAGSAGRFFFGGVDDDFSKWANLADRQVRWQMVGCTTQDVQKRSPYPQELNFPLHEERFEDKWFVVDFVGQYPANPWGLNDVVGNVSEWTRSSYRPYPYRDDDGRNDGSLYERKVVRGGSWNSRPRDAGSSIRIPYETYQPVHDVGFRVIIED